MFLVLMKSGNTRGLLALQLFKVPKLLRVGKTGFSRIRVDVHPSDIYNGRSYFL